jgi:PAS domain S-box-containing protein
MTTPSIAATGPVAVVNDDPLQLQLLAGILAKDGFRALPFTGAAEALAALRCAPPALIVTDLYMPGIDGWRFCRLLRSHEFASLNRVPILVVSATFAGEEARRIAKDLGAEAMLSMPVDGPSFLATVRTLLAGKSETHQPLALIVEDDEAIARILRKGLESHGYQVETSPTRARAEPLVHGMAFDLALIDYRLPDGCGDALLPIVRESRPDCACIMMTADADPALALAFMQQGASAYIRKPFDVGYVVELCGKARREQGLLRVEDRLEQRTRELRESEERYRTLFRNSADATILLVDGVHADCNQALLTLLRCARDEVIGHGPAELSPEYQPDGSRSDEKAAVLVREAFASGSRRFEWLHRRPDGTELWVDVVATALTIDGKPALFGSWRDITERKRAVDGLRIAEEYRRSLLQAAMDGFCMLDSQGWILEVNDAYCRMTGYGSQELLRMAISDLGDKRGRSWTLDKTGLHWDVRIG